MDRCGFISVEFSSGSPTAARGGVRCASPSLLRVWERRHACWRGRLIYCGDAPMTTSRPTLDLMSFLKACRCALPPSLFTHSPQNKIPYARRREQPLTTTTVTTCTCPATSTQCVSASRALLGRLAAGSGTTHRSHARRLPLRPPQAPCSAHQARAARCSRVRHAAPLWSRAHLTAAALPAHPSRAISAVFVLRRRFARASCKTREDEVSTGRLTSRSSRTCHLLRR